jgi:hypothetical protein
MKTATDLRTGPLVLAAPTAGRVRLYPPRVLCGELEIFEAHETIATVSSDGLTERIEAPVRGFLLRTYVIDDAVVGAGSPLVVLSPTG